jgi:beta-N-acetylhexosaminidase
MKTLPILAFSLLGTIACNAQAPKSEKPKYEMNAATSTLKEGNEKLPLGKRYFAEDAYLDKQVEEVYNNMTAQQRAAQMIMVASSEALGFPYQTTVKRDVKNEMAANVLFLKGTKNEFIKQRKELEGMEINGLKPSFACDCEPTLLHNKFVGEPKMLPTGSLQKIEEVNSSVDTINALMDEMGIGINFAPIVDIAANKSIINKRSFGNNPSTIKSLAAAFIERTQASNKVATVKHFPGHGAVVGDTHKQSVMIDGKLTELPTFQSIIQKEQPIMVMVGHISVKNNPDGFNTEGGRPATTSRKIVTDLLRNQIGYQGIITTDAMNMQASKNFQDADWEAAKAGVDLILMPLNAAKLNVRIADEIEKGTELGKQFESSVKRIIKLKLLQQRR